ncbi:sigma-70 family RNA polymerase sigma factor [Pseudonocardia sp. GCM10023141]|uniref:sigma-70 family RNA polymerase sigma factor n=1 Tax=Pseudonocardia sp. GCM10023141 TaxID=3252653 RepID=UPI003621C935
MDEHDLLARRFEESRGQMRAVAYRMLGSLSEADDAVQEAWIRLSRVDAGGVENLGGWLTTVVSRVCLDMLRSRRSRHEESLEVHLPDLLVSRADGMDPEQEALLADSVGVAMAVVLGELAPAERLAFVLHDMFAVPFDEVAQVLGREPAAVRQLASRARRRVQGSVPAPTADRMQQRELADAFLAASRSGDRDALLAVLDPHVLLRVDAGADAPAPGTSKLVRGAHDVVAQALMFSSAAWFARPALVNGTPGLITIHDGRTLGVMGFTVRGGRIAEIHILADPVRLEALDVSAFR